MKIIKYKRLSNDKYKVYLDDNQNIILHENIILKYDLLIKKEITDLNQIIKDNNNYLVYDISLKYISTKMRSENELRMYLKKKEIDNKLINDTINKLKQNGYINDRQYAKYFIMDKINLNKYGPNKIKTELLKLKIDKDIIEEELQNINKTDILNNLESIIDKSIKSNKSYAGDVLKQRILSNLINKGYKKEDILNILSTKDLSNNQLYEKEYTKLYKKYSKKYSEEELDYIIKQKLYLKGFKKNN
ncbi:MAG: RecX family transcriptional regulator [Bacilli bacterium]|nr:RecX family transcriptional regulator [Bacilli bacterium]